LQVENRPHEFYVDSLRSFGCGAFPYCGRRAGDGVERGLLDDEAFGVFYAVAVNARTGPPMERSDFGSVISIVFPFAGSGAGTIEIIKRLRAAADIK
jgi:hypothetical protein